jgi:hypothetical protein
VVTVIQVKQIRVARGIRVLYFSAFCDSSDNYRLITDIEYGRRISLNFLAITVN